MLIPAISGETGLILFENDELDLDPGPDAFFLLF